MAPVRKVLFVCLGNICRSPIAEAVFLDLVKKREVEDQWEADSAAIGGWHAGSPPDHRAKATLRKHNIFYNGIARQIEEEDFHEFDFIFGMDENNFSSLNRDKPQNSRSEVLLLGDFDPQGDRIIRDPYYDTNSEGFEKCFQQCVRCCNAFLDKHS